MLPDGTPIILYGQLYTNYQFTITEVNTYAQKKKNTILSKGNEVIVPASGETAEDIARASAVRKKGVILGGDLNIIVPIPSMNAEFFALSLSNGFPQKKLAQKAQGKSVVHIHNSDIQEISITYPSLEEQNRIASFFRHLDRLVALHQCNCNMATRPCEWSSGLRAIAWEQRKFSDLVQIERGGSPRPIEKYITDEPNGLNWIKIGDAPLQGNYITKTDEKIKPSGLSKTRQVHPGDLILSNSMSFGRPYILAISGCIHDGWLLIRDVQNKFDLKFLCYLLGTDQMLDQYKALASGSTVNNLNKDLVGNTQITIPDITEQKVLGEYFDLLDRLITLHQRKHILLT